MRLRRVQKRTNRSVMPRESGASSNHHVVGFAQSKSVVTGSPAFAGDDTSEAFIVDQFGSTICCTVFEVPPSGGGLKTWIETARYPMIPVFCTGPGAA